MANHHRHETYMQRRQRQERVNKKAIYWIAGIAVVIVAALSILLVAGVN